MRYQKCDSTNWFLRFYPSDCHKFEEVKPLFSACWTLPNILDGDVIVGDTRVGWSRMSLQHHRHGFWPMSGERNPACIVCNQIIWYSDIFCMNLCVCIQIVMCVYIYIIYIYNVHNYTELYRNMYKRGYPSVSSSKQCGTKYKASFWGLLLDLFVFCA